MKFRIKFSVDINQTTLYIRLSTEQHSKLLLVSHNKIYCPFGNGFDTYSDYRKDYTKITIT